MKKLSLDDLKKGKLSKNVINNLDLLKGGSVAPAEFCHVVLGQAWGKPEDKMKWT